jgi:hypothetical protein
VDGHINHKRTHYGRCEDAAPALDGHEEEEIRHSSNDEQRYIVVRAENVVPTSAHNTGGFSCIVCISKFICVQRKSFDVSIYAIEVSVNKNDIRTR